MSNQVNTKLLERACEMMDFWAGTQHAQRIEFLMGLSDLDEIEKAVREAESEAYRELKEDAMREMAADVSSEMTDERADVMFKEFGDVF